MTCTFKEIIYRKDKKTYDEVASIQDHMYTTGYISNANLES